MAEYHIIDSRERSTMGSSWNEYLCITKLANENYELSIRGYEVIGEYGDYCDDEGEYSEPNEINGQIVIGVEDGFIVGGDLVQQSEDDGTVEFKHPSNLSVAEWLQSVKWTNIDLNKAVDAVR